MNNQTIDANLYSEELEWMDAIVPLKYLVLVNKKWTLL